jgi:hypothetical protein
MIANKPTSQIWGKKKKTSVILANFAQFLEKFAKFLTSEK